MCWVVDMFCDCNVLQTFVLSIAQWLLCSVAVGMASLVCHVVAGTSGYGCHAAKGC